VRLSEAVGRALVACGADHVFGLVGSGNFHVTNALVAGGARFVPAVHEAGAAVMADAFARVSGRPAVLSLHQGPGVTNALTGITEAAKSRSPLVVLAAEAPNPRSNFHIDLPSLSTAVGAVFHRIHPEHAVDCVAGVWRTASRGSGRTVVLGLPLDAQQREVDFAPVLPLPVEVDPAQPDVSALVAALTQAQRPVFIAGRGAARTPVESRVALARLAERCGALLAVSAGAKGLFAGDPWYLDVAGGFATPLAAELIAESDLVVAWGSTLNMWTTRHGTLIAPDAVVAQVDLEADALGVNRPVDVGVLGDVVTVADACTVALGASARPGRRTPRLRRRIAAEGTWRTVSYVDTPEPGRVDPRTLSVALDAMLPAARTVVVDSGNFMGYPSMFLDVPDAAGFCFTQAFQAIGLGLSSALGAAVARPDRLTVAALGDGGFLMSSAELATAVRLDLPLLVVVYDDAAYGAEVHHFGPDGHPLDTVTLPDTDLAAIARGHGCAGVTVRTVGDLDAVRDWLEGPPRGVLVVDAKVDRRRGSWWLEEAFRGH
jgi:acetolactate synthase-1/2/3 large subunit